jgi:homogentisate 1,2-dioxygenase
MTPHGPDTATYEASISQQQQQPSHLGHNTLAFMFETSLTPRVTPAALGSPCIDRDYYKCWVGLKSHFDRQWHSKQQQQQQANGDAAEAEAAAGAAVA